MNAAEPATVAALTPILAQDRASAPHGRTPATWSITIMKPTVDAELLGAVLHRLSTVVVRVLGTRTLATQPCTALEIAVRLSEPTGNAEATLALALRELADRCQADIALRRAWIQPRLVAFDLDSTLVSGETIDRLAAHVGRAAEVRAATDRAMRGEAGFAESLRARVSMLAGLPVEVLRRIADDMPLSPGALTAIRTLQARHVRVGVISGGFTHVVRRFANRLGLDFHAANELEEHQGVLTGRLVGPIIDGKGKARQLLHQAARARVTSEECVSVGDGANDIEMLTTAGFGIAYNAKPIVRAVADAVISRPRLDLVLPLLGIPIPCADLMAA